MNNIVPNAKCQQVLVLAVCLVSVTIRLHSSTTYVDAVRCYRPISVVCRSVTVVSPAKTAEPIIEMPFGLLTLVGPRNHVLDGVQMLQWEGALLGQCLTHCVA